MIDEKEPTLIIDDPFIGKREVGPGYVGAIRDQLKLLQHFRDDGRKPSAHLLEDIQVYEFILAHPQAEAAAEQYMKAMEKQRQKHGYGVRKMKVAKMLGWFQ